MIIVMLINQPDFINEKGTNTAFKIQPPLIKALIDNTDPEILFKNEKICNQKVNYLGFVTDQLERIKYYIIALSTSWGKSCRNTSRILIYDSKKKYIGNYYTGFLPDDLINNCLVFESGEKSPNFSNGYPPKFKIDEIEFTFEKNK